MSETETAIRSLKTDLGINLIDVSPDNVRKSKVNVGLEELKASIEHIGLIQPVIVEQTGERYSLIVGQRRFEACKALGKTTIPALIIGD
ncbi:MAG: ParB/RepB/Spo0J family partition protein, partial [Nitrososphaerales archaeon]